MVGKLAVEPGATFNVTCVMKGTVKEMNKSGDNKDNNENKKPGKQLKNVAVLSGIAIQMGVTIYLFVLLGKWLDTKFNNNDKLFHYNHDTVGCGYFTVCCH